MRSHGLKKQWLVSIALLLGVMLIAKGENKNHLSDWKQGQFGGESSVSAPTVIITQGKLVGINKSGMNQFLGVRYALSPAGAMRWRPPQPVPAGKKEISAVQFGNNCPQSASPFGSASLSEDCLFLNIYTPGNSNKSEKLKALPVMVWIHGGGLRSGAGSSYNPVDLVRRGNVIVVTINYRLGVLGFLAHAAFNDENHDVANYGLMDQQLALKWIKDNIAAFGGNPKNVTIFGESGGATTVYANMASPRANGLFQKAIIQSGFLSDISLKTAEELGASFAKRVNCSKGSSKEITDCLRKLPVSAILPNQNLPIHGAVIIDGKILPQPLMSAFKEGKFNRVPIINGTNRDEGNLLTAVLFDLSGKKINADDYQAALKTVATWEAEVIPGFAYKQSDAENIAKEYPPNDYHHPGLAVSAVITDSALACPSYEANLLFAHWTPTWVYEFSDKDAPEIAAPPISFPYDASHFSEMPFLFDMSKLTRPGSTPLTEAQRELSKQMIQYWTSFAHNGNPNNSTNLNWPQFKGASSILKLDQPKSKIENDFWTVHKCDFWTKF